TRPAEKVEPGVPAVLHPLDRSNGTNGHLNRLDLARWTVDPANPLTTRVIVTSATYRQSSRVRPELANVDPLNKLLARQSRLRLDAEVIRDNALFTSGLLSPKLGGPPVYPPQPDGVMTLGQSKRDWKASTGD